MSSTAAPLYVQYGCGISAPEKWLNFDCSPTLRIQRIPLLGRFRPKSWPDFPPGVTIGDVRKGLPVAAASCAGVYASHVLEHLSLDDMRQALVETLRILRPGGIFRAVVPDLEFITREYLAGTAPDSAHVFMHHMNMGKKQRSRGISGLLRSSFGNSEHLWMWDYKALAAELHAAGFVSIRRCQFDDSSDAMFKLVENPARFEGAVAIEALRAR